MKVIDVSKWQGNIDWTKVDVDGAIIRVGVGTSDAKEGYWKKNIEGCVKNNIPFGVYLYSKATTVAQAQKEAQFTLNQIKGYSLSLPVFFDTEEKGTESASKACADAFCKVITDAGYKAGIYCSESWFNSFIKATVYSPWIAKYSSNSPSIGQEMIGWQYTSKASVNGISGNVDMSYWYGETETKTVSIIFGSARSSETGGINGTKGDQNNGKEVSTQTYYNHSKGWYVLRANNADTRAKLAKAMSDACNNNKIGYGQSDRLTGWNEAGKVGYDMSKISNACNVDCSELVRCCVRYATGKDIGDIYTGNERSVLLNTGLFTDVTSKVTASTGAGLYNGDILVTKTKGHTGIIVSGGGSSSASSGTKATSGTKVATADYKDSSLAGTYTVTGCSKLNMRADAGTQASVITVLSKGEKVKNYGYYSKSGDTKWLYVAYGKLTGFVSSKYLKK